MWTHITHRRVIWVQVAGSGPCTARTVHVYAAESVEDAEGPESLTCIGGKKHVPYQQDPLTVLSLQNVSTFPGPPMYSSSSAKNV